VAFSTLLLIYTCAHKGTAEKHKCFKAFQLGFSASQKGPFLPVAG